MDNTNNELYHYGRLGMRWGIRRASRTLGSAKASNEQKEKAINSLKKHRGKATRKVARLEKRATRLEKRLVKRALRKDVKAAKLRRKAAVKEHRAYNWWLLTTRRREKMLFKAKRKLAKAKYLESKTNKYKALLTRNKTKQMLFNKGISDIDKELVNRGKMALTVDREKKEKK